MKRKLTALISAAAMMLSLVSCGSADPAPAPEQSATVMLPSSLPPTTKRAVSQREKTESGAGQATVSIREPTCLFLQWVRELIYSTIALFRIR